MGIFTRDPNIEIVVLQLVQLIAAYKRAADKQVKRCSKEEEEKTGKFTFVIMGLSPRDLVPDARNIITHSIAKWLDSTFDHAETIVGSKVLQSLRSEEVDLYLKLVMLTMESWLGGKNRVKARAMIWGSDYHLERGESYVNNKQWALAEAEFHRALEYDEEIFPLYGGLVVSLANTGLTLHFQERDYEAIEYFEKSITAFEKLQPDAISYDKAREGYELAKALLKQ